jgi:hypothetical protein
VRPEQSQQQTRGLLRVLGIPWLRYEGMTGPYCVAHGLDRVERFVDDVVEQFEFSPTNQDGIRRS